MSCDQDHLWVFERVEDLVRIKTQLGFPTSFSQELIALASAALQSNPEYGTIVREMLRNASSEGIEHDYT